MIIVWPLIAFSYPEDYLLDNYWRLLGLEKLPLWKFCDVYDYFFILLKTAFDQKESIYTQVHVIVQFQDECMIMNDYHFTRNRIDFRIYIMSDVVVVEFK